MKCEYIDSCDICKKFKTSPSGRIWFENYCQGNPYDCERKRLSDEKVEVPDNLFPDGSRMNEYFDIEP